MAGRPRKPGVLKLLAGNPGRRPIPVEPSAPRGLPGAPRDLEPDVLVAWDELSRDLDLLGVLQVVDRTAVGLAAWHLARRRRLAAFLVENGEVYETVTSQGCTMRRARPEVAMLGVSDGYLARFLSENGLTPTGRARLGVVSRATVDSADKDFA